MREILDNEQVNLKLLEKIYNAKNLIRLSLAGVDPNLDDDQKKYIGWGLRSLISEKPSLKSLGLDNASIDILSAALLDPKCPIIEIRLNSLSSELVVKLGEILTNPSCKVTRLRLHSFDAMSVMALGKILDNPSCKVTTLKFEALDEPYGKVFGEILTNPSCKVTTLGLRSGGETSVKGLGKIVNNSGCKVTTLTFDEPPGKALGGILNNPNCKVTTLGLSFLEETSVMELVEILNNPSCKVTTLELLPRNETSVKAARDLLKGLSRKILVHTTVNLGLQGKEIISLKAQGITILDTSGQANLSPPSSLSSTSSVTQSKNKRGNDTQDFPNNKRARLDATPQLPSYTHSGVQDSSNPHSSFIHLPSSNRMTRPEQTSLTPFAPTSSSTNSPIGTPVNFFGPGATRPASSPLPLIPTPIPTVSSIRPSSSTPQNQRSFFSSASTITEGTSSSLPAGNKTTNLGIHNLEGSAFTVGKGQGPRPRPEIKIKEEPVSEGYYPHR